MLHLPLEANIFLESLALVQCNSHLILSLVPINLGLHVVNLQIMHEVEYYVLDFLFIVVELLQGFEILRSLIEDRLNLTPYANVLVYLQGVQALLAELFPLYHDLPANFGTRSAGELTLPLVRENVI